jgi:hypothetical protein
VEQLFTGGVALAPRSQGTAHHGLGQRVITERDDMREQRAYELVHCRSQTEGLMEAKSVEARSSQVVVL